MQVPAPAENRSGGLPYKWIVAGVIIFGLFMTILDGTIVNIAIPRLQSTFGATLTSVQWVLTAYTLVQGVATPLTAFLAQRLGQKRLYILALTGFTAGSALCGFAFNLPMLIFFRVVQGAMGAFMSPLAITLLYSEFPVEERGVALGALGIPILLAPAIGPTVGGYIVTFLGWQLIFFINVPIGIVGGILALIYLRESRVEQRTSFDVPGFLLSALGLSSLLYGISDANTDGWGSIKVLLFLAVGTIFLVAFVVVELQKAASGKQALLDIRVFANAAFTTSTIASMFVIFALYGGLFILPIYLQDLRGLSAYQAGLLLLPQAFASMVASLVAGRLVDKVGVRLVIIPGLCILTFALWLFSFLSTDTPFETIQMWLIVRSFALGFCFQPLSVASFAEMPVSRLAQATSVSTTVRFVISSLAVAVIATLVQSRTTFHYVRLAEQVTANSPLGQFLLTLQGYFASKGASLSAAYAAAVQEVSGLVQLQATILAMRDAFLISMGLTFLAIIASLFVGSRRTKKNTPPLSKKESQEAAVARDEAGVAI